MTGGARSSPQRGQRFDHFMFVVDLTGVFIFPISNSRVFVPRHLYTLPEKCAVPEKTSSHRSISKCGSRSLRDKTRKPISCKQRCPRMKCTAAMLCYNGPKGFCASLKSRSPALLKTRYTTRVYILREICSANSTASDSCGRLVGVLKKWRPLVLCPGFLPRGGV
jgi:hypothetical protein